MFREMRRKKQSLPEEVCIDILNRGISGVLALDGDDDYPYAVPVNYLYDSGKIYFHGAKSGHKIDSIKKNEKASFCVVDEDKVIPEKYTTYFRSVIVFGKIRILEDDTEKRSAIEKLAIRFAPNDTEENRQKAIEREYPPLCVMELTIEHMTGKEALELMKQKEEKN